MRDPSIRFSDDRVRLASIAGAILIVLLAASVIFTVARYDTALGKAKAVAASRASALIAQQAATSYWSEREAMNEYFLLHSADLLAEVDQRSIEFDRVAADLDRTSAAGSTFGARARTGNAADQPGPTGRGPRGRHHQAARPRPRARGRTAVRGPGREARPPDARRRRA
jgi:hypothetical protein